MPLYLVEVYIPQSGAREAAASGRRARAAVGEMARGGLSITFIRTTFLPDDETCFHVFEAVSAELVEEAVRRAELGAARVVPAVEASGSPDVLDV